VWPANAGGPSIAVEALHVHEVRQLEEQLGPAWQGRGTLSSFAMTWMPMEAQNVVRYFHGLLAKAGLPREPLPNLRHTAARLVLAQGVDCRLVQRVRGHSQIALTVNLYYIHIMPILRKGAAERMDAIVRMGRQKAEAGRRSGAPGLGWGRNPPFFG